MQLCQALCLACGKPHVNNMGQGSVHGNQRLHNRPQCLRFLPSLYAVKHGATLYCATAYC